MMKRVVISVLILLFQIQVLHAQSGNVPMRWRASLLTTIPQGVNDNIQPRLGALGMLHFTVDRSPILDVYAGLGIGLTRSELQYLDVDSMTWWQGADERILYARTEIFLSFDLDAKKRFSLELGPGAEWVLHRRIAGTRTTEVTDNKKPFTLKEETSEQIKSRYSIRGILGVRLIYHADVHGTKIDLGPYFDYASFLGGQFEEETSSRKFGFLIGLKF